MNVTLWIIASLLAAVFAAVGVKKLTTPREQLIPNMASVADHTDSQVKAVGTDAGAAHQLRTWLAQTRHWLDTTNRTFETLAVHRTPSEMIDRRSQLEAILDTAPADCRQIIDQLQAGQLTLDDASELLTFATDQQDARREWILEHWPHVVECNEIERLSASNPHAPALPTRG